MDNNNIKSGCIECTTDRRAALNGAQKDSLVYIRDVENPLSKRSGPLSSLLLLRFIIGEVVEVGQSGWGKGG